MLIGQLNEQIPHCTQRAGSGTTCPAARAWRRAVSCRNRSFSFNLLVRSGGTPGSVPRNRRSLLRCVFADLGLVVALIAIDRGLAALVAIGAIAAGIAMIHRKTVPRYVDFTPIAWGMALRALPAPMSARGIATVAALAVVHTLVAETGAFPGAGAMALRALPGVMVGRFIIVMAALAVGQPAVGEGRAFPGSRCYGIGSTAR